MTIHVPTIGLATLFPLGNAPQPVNPSKSNATLTTPKTLAEYFMTLECEWKPANASR